MANLKQRDLREIQELIDATDAVIKQMQEAKKKYERSMRRRYLSWQKRIDLSNAGIAIEAHVNETVGRIAKRIAGL